MGEGSELIQAGVGLHPSVLGVPITHRTLPGAVAEIVDRGRTGSGGFACLANVHMVMEAVDDPSFLSVLHRAALVAPDGVPLVWALQASGNSDAERVAGLELTESVLDHAEGGALAVGFYGGEDKVLRALVAAVRRDWPSVRVSYALSPPFRTLTEGELDGHIAAINASGTQILFVGLGCPKQERWMARNEERIGAVMVGVGAVFDVIAGVRRRAPAPIRRAGLEWLFRLVQEPGRLFRRYARHNPRFLIRASWEQLMWRFGGRRP